MCGGAIISDFIGVKRDRDLWFELDPSVDLLGLGAAFNTPNFKDLPPLNFEKFFSSDKKGTNHSHFHFLFVLFYVVCCSPTIPNFYIHFFSNKIIHHELIMMGILFIFFSVTLFLILVDFF
jgi:hypothetical protein